MLPRQKNQDFGQKTAKFDPKYAFLLNLGLILAFLIHFSTMPDKKNNANEVPRWLSDMWVPELLLRPKMIRMFGPKTAIFATKYASLGGHI